MSIFKARVQYNDFKGTVAADVSDNKSFLNYLVEIGLANKNEEIVGYRIVFNENSGREIEEPGVVVYLQDETLDDPTSTIRAIDQRMPTKKFFSFFKRFDMVMTRDGSTFEGVEVDGPD